MCSRAICSAALKALLSDEGVSIGEVNLEVPSCCCCCCCCCDSLLTSEASLGGPYTSDGLLKEDTESSSSLDLTDVASARLAVASFSPLAMSLSPLSSDLLPGRNSASFSLSTSISSLSSSTATSSGANGATSSNLSFPRLFCMLPPACLTRKH